MPTVVRRDDPNSAFWITRTLMSMVDLTSRIKYRLRIYIRMFILVFFFFFFSKFDYDFISNIRDLGIFVERKLIRKINASNSRNERDGTIILGHSVVGASLSSRPCAYVGDRKRRYAGVTLFDITVFLLFFFPLLRLSFTWLVTSYRVMRIYAHLRTRLACDCSRKTRAIYNSVTQMQLPREDWIERDFILA